MIKSEQVKKREMNKRNMLHAYELSGKVRVMAFDIKVDNPETDFTLGIINGGKGAMLPVMSRIAIFKEGEPVQAVVAVGYLKHQNTMRAWVETDSEAFCNRTKVKGLAQLGTWRQVSGVPYDVMGTLPIIMTTDEPLEPGTEVHGTLFYVTD